MMSMLWHQRRFPLLVRKQSNFQHVLVQLQLAANSQHGPATTHSCATGLVSSRAEGGVDEGQHQTQGI
jgi:hypothetical protein